MKYVPRSRKLLKSVCSNKSWNYSQQHTIVISRAAVACHATHTHTRNLFTNPGDFTSSTCLNQKTKVIITMSNGDDGNDDDDCLSVPQSLCSPNSHSHTFVSSRGNCIAHPASKQATTIVQNPHQQPTKLSSLITFLFIFHFIYTIFNFSTTNKHNFTQCVNGRCKNRAHRPLMAQFIYDRPQHIHIFFGWLNAAQSHVCVAHTHAEQRERCVTRLTSGNIDKKKKIARLPREYISN